MKANRGRLNPAINNLIEWEQLYLFARLHPLETLCRDNTYHRATTVLAAEALARKNGHLVPRR